MPIRPENRGLYPRDWPQIRARIRTRSGGKCERCGVPHAVTVFRRDRAGAWFNDTDGTWRSPDDGRVIGDASSTSSNPHYLESIGEARAVPIILTCAHVDHNPRHCADVNLLDLCQQCHNRHDALDRARGRKERDRAQRALGDLFEGAKA